MPASLDSPSESLSHNERTVLALVQQHGLIGRADMAQHMGLTTQSVSRLVDGLSTRGLVQLGQRVTKRGNPKAGQGVELAADGMFSLGVSLMTDALSLVLMNLRGQVLARHFQPQPDVRISALLEQVASLSQSMLEAHVPDRSRIAGVGVAVPGFFVEDARVINPPPPLDDLALVDLPALLQERLQLPVQLENDASAAAVAESFIGAGLRHRSFGYLHFAEGVGGGVVLDGKLLRGRHGNAGEVAGVMPLDMLPDRPSLRLLLQLAQAEGAPATSLTELLTDFDAHMPGVDAWLERTRLPLQMMLSSLFSVLDPDAIVLGGRLPPALAQRMIAGVGLFNDPRRNRPRPLPPIIPAEAGQEPTAIGAAVLPLKTLLFT